MLGEAKSSYNATGGGDSSLLNRAEFSQRKSE